MIFSKRRRTIAAVWGATSLLGVGLLAEKTYETMQRHETQAEELRTVRQSAAQEYLLQIPTILRRLESSQAYHEAELRGMEERLGATCLNAMLSDQPALSFDDALAPRECAYSDDQLDQAQMFYVSTRSAAERLRTYRNTITDDPTRSDDTVDTLRIYAYGQPEVAEVPTRGESLQPVTVPEMISIVRATDTGFTLQELETPDVHPEPISYRLLGLWFYAGLSTLLSGGFLLADRLYTRALERKYNKVLEKTVTDANELEDIAVAFQTVDPIELSRIVSELPKD